MKGRFAAVVVVLGGFGLAALSLSAHAQLRVQCESRNQQYQFCQVDAAVNFARIERQISGARCIEGSSWGWSQRGIWVNRGCAAVFYVDTYRPGPGPGSGRDIVNCASRNYQYSFCPTDVRIISAEVVRQISREPCITGRNWGWRGNGVWVSEGCEADFRLRADYRPGPPAHRPGTIVCESHEYRYNFCSTGPIRDVQLVEQRSQAACVQGRTWGWRNDGIWVDNGCEAAFRIRSR